MGLTKSNFYQKPEVVIESSWDDGGVLDVRIAELLKETKIKGTFYVVLDWIGKEGYMTWEDIQRLDKEGFNIGSHTISHPADLKMLFDEQLHYEIQNSKDLLETALGHRITSFCYPRGRADERVKDKVKKSGYESARGTGKTGITKIEDNFYLPGTIHIYQRKEYDNKSIFDYSREIIDKVKREGGYINIWGHSRELQKFSLWDTLERVLNYVREK